VAARHDERVAHELDGLRTPDGDVEHDRKREREQGKQETEARRIVQPAHREQRKQ
jgi:hypothetical protein